MSADVGMGFLRLLSDLWNGRVALDRVFWQYAVVYGSLANLIATAAGLAAFAQGWPVALGLAVHFLPVPYNLLMVVSVWRSAMRYAGAAIWSIFARALILLWAIVVTLA